MDAQTVSAGHACLTLALLAPVAASLAVAQSASPAAANTALTDYIFVDSFESSDCSAALACPVPAAGKACISGQLSEAGSAAPLRALFNRGLPCGEGAVGGVCDLALAAHDALSFASNPSTSAALQNHGQTLDGCGRFRFVDVSPPASGTVAIAADDDSGLGDDYAATATFHSLAANAHVDGIAAVATLRTTADAWTNSAGGANLVDSGAILLTYRASDAPQSGVVVTKDGNTAAPQDFYFADAGSTRYVIDPDATATGANGSALFIGGAFAMYSGAGGPMDCVWPQVLATSIAGIVVFVQLRC